MSTTEDPWKDPDRLSSLYHDDGLNQSEIGDELGTSAATISYWMDKHSIETSHTSHKNPNRHEAEGCTNCGTDVPGNALICAECLDEARHKDAN